MKPPAFAYHDPGTVEEACTLMATLDNARLLAGGQSMMPMLNMRFVMPDHLVDLGCIPALSAIEERPGGLRIGAMTRQRDLEHSAVVRARCPLLADAIQWVGHRQTRNRGTIGGSLCQLDPAAELPAVCAALDAVLTVQSARGVRTMPFQAFPAGYMTPSLEPDELLTAIELPDWPQGHGHGFVEFARRHGDYAVVLAAALLVVDAAGKITRVSLTLGGIGPAPVRVAAVEQALVGQVASAALFRQATEACRALEAMEDIHAPASYRQQLAVVMSRRALDAALASIAQGGRATGAAGH
ncbi:MAG: FAD binding domain-containing protein [bacterium]|jgi:carbon-monoxide dehydrogenase medium subunit|nr:xanthine dehydrogenase family protein subunit M [Rhodocyclaceae bacterium]MCE2980563.1 xanthine dehydrogenase family protein subunit M [Betaproteobacteria bacterium]